MVCGESLCIQISAASERAVVLITCWDVLVRTLGEARYELDAFQHGRCSYLG